MITLTINKLLTFRLMISRASVLALFGKNLINVSVKNAKMPSINGRYRFAEEKKK